MVKESYKVSGFFVFFLIHASFVGAGALSFQHFMLDLSGYDTWIVVLLTGLSLHLIIGMIFKMLGNPAKDVIDLHRFLFGKSLGSIVSLILVGYFFLLALTTLRSYIEIIQIWMFPHFKTWVLVCILVCILYYAVSGGFRVIVGYCFFGFLFSSLLPLFLYFNLKYGHASNLVPMVNHSVRDLFASSRFSGIFFMGFESVLLYYPFIKAPENNAKWAHFGLLFATFKYSALMFITFMYFSEGLIQHTFWPTFVMLKVIEFSFIERIEFIFICMWLVIIIPVLCLSIWSCTRIIKRTTKLKPTWSLLLILLVMFLAAIPFDDRIKVHWLGMQAVHIGFYFIYAYIPLLFVLYLIRSGLSRNARKEPKTALPEA
ncbi:GerAB/ArcD/ProY family transporter [Paenibacillus sp. UNC496MF]|uniref:GerAB/ArcD/ProY family transporter n=1 Tax=Paenibacillus sp. UNC496MF TaxID=1502753 RepID=UPI00210C77D8|nr:GerAB/ArcD/ProY family transporter [Paenibacillus sp. UNC496MF]